MLRRVALVSALGEDIVRLCMSVPKAGKELAREKG
jgi:hypothetical protein